MSQPTRPRTGLSRQPRTQQVTTGVGAFPGIRGRSWSLAGRFSVVVVLGDEGAEVARTRPGVG